MGRPAKTLILGGGQAGARLAMAMREAGSRDEITMICAERHYPYERPNLSKERLEQPNAPLAHIFDAAGAREADIDVRRRTSALSIDRKARQVRTDRGVCDYDRLVIATGSRLNKLQLAGAPNNQVHYLRTAQDSAALARRMRYGANIAIVGAGVIGLEVAAAAAKRGCSTTLVEISASVLPRMQCPAASDAICAHLQRLCVKLHLGARTATWRDRILHLADGREIPADFVVAGLGVRPETALAEAAGLAIDDGVVTDEFGQTSDPSIFAVGDVAHQFHPLFGRHLHLKSWDNANAQAIAAGRTLAGEPTPNLAIPWMWSDQGALNLQVVGLPHLGAGTVRRDHADGGFTIFHHNGGALAGAISINCPQDVPLVRRFLKSGPRPFVPDQIANGDLPLRKILTAASLSS